MSKKYQNIVAGILGLADVKINGNNPWDIHVYNENFYRRALTEGDLGLGESYMEGWWDAEKVDETIYKILRAGLDEKIRKRFAVFLNIAKARLINMQSKRRAFIIGERHYDLGNDLFQNMLDKRMNYSCGYWKNAKNLDEAQVNKLELICKKLYLEPGMRVLDIGCGWGAFGKFAAERYNVKVVGITVSKEQVELGQKLCAGLPVEFRLIDYRSLNESFDRIVSVGMIEHVGYKNYKTFFKIASKCLNENGLFLLHTIGNNVSVKTVGNWINKYIFPNSMNPSLAQLGNAVENLFVTEDLHNFGADYDKTLLAWFNNFDQNWPEIKNKYPDSFYRMWKYYLLSCAGAFRARNMQLWQLVLSKNGLLNGYLSVR